MSTDNQRLHAVFEMTTQFRRPTKDNGDPCGCVWRGDGVRLSHCSQHPSPLPGMKSPLGMRSAATLNHSKKTGSPSARAARRMRQLAREGLKEDHKKKRAGG